MFHPPERFKKMPPSNVQSRLQLAIGFTFFIFCAELFGGFWANSLALIGDAGHMFMDAFALSLSWFALKISDQPATSTKTFGYHRMEIFAALANGLLIFAMAAAILYHAVLRFQHPQEVQGLAVIVVAVLGLLTNIAVIFLLKDSVKLHSHDLNIKSAFWHVLGDSVASVGVIVSGLIIYFKGWFIADAVMGVAICGLLFWGARSLIGDAWHILLEGVPKGVSLEDVEKALVAIPEVRDVHELHIWCICSNIYALSAHALVNDQKVNQMEPLLIKIEAALKSQFNISHSTIQFESNPCGQVEALCEMKH